MTKSNIGNDFTDAELYAVPVAQRDLLRTFAGENCSYEHLARVFDLPIGTVKSRISRARQKITRLRERNQPRSEKDSA